MLLYLREQSFDFSVNENLIVLYTTEFLLLLAPTKSCLIIVVILYRYNDLSSICNQNTFDEENFDFQIDTASHKVYPLHRSGGNEYIAKKSYAYQYKRKRHWEREWLLIG